MSESLMIEYPDGSGSGHAGNDTSRERQEREDATGITAETQRMALTMLENRGHLGMTAAEFEDLAGIGHGRASSALSHLHRAGHIRRIRERRQKHEIYVVRDAVAGREESPYRPRISARRPRDYTEEEMLDLLRRAGFPKTAEDKLYILERVFKVMP